MTYRIALRRAANTPVSVDLPTHDEEGKLPDVEFLPTDTYPGSAARLAVFEERRRAGFPLWHPDDRQGYD